jgi:hypothetical protein
LDFGGCLFLGLHVDRNGNFFGSSFDGESSFPRSVVALEDKISLRMVIQILLHWNDFGGF